MTHEHIVKVHSSHTALPLPGERESGARKRLNRLAQIPSKPLKRLLPPIHCCMLSVGRTIHREEAVAGIVIHVELVGLPPFFECLLGLRHILWRRAPILLPKEP